jgi:hypothetical protein
LPDHRALQRRRAGWVFAALLVGYIPINLAVKHWVASASGVVFFLYAVALAVSRVLSLNVGWVRRKFQVRDRDPTRKDAPPKNE